MYNRQSRVNSYRVFDLIAALDQLGEVIWNAMCTGKAWPLRGGVGGGVFCKLDKLPPGCQCIEVVKNILNL